jgi:transcriptional regulator GlxA family with amidase domain
MNRQEAILVTLGGVAAAAIPGFAHANEPQTHDGNLTPPKGPIYVAFVVGKGSNVIDNAGPWEVFQDTMVPERGNTEEDQMPFHLGMVSDSDAVLEATGGMEIKPGHTFATIPVQPHVIVIGAQGEHTPNKIEWIRKASEKADIVMSVCTGAFLLAQTGLLDGLSATTHHEYYDDFAKKFPKVRLERGPRYVENGKIATAGGLTSGIELALRVVERYFGSETTSRTASYMEYTRSPRRPPY